MQRQKKLSALRRVLGPFFLRGEEAVFFCPKHPARAGRPTGQLSVNVRTDWFNCWSCGFKDRSLVPLLRLGDRETLAEYVDELLGSGPRRKDPPKKQHVSPFLPAEFRSISVESREPAWHATMAYLSRRGVTPEESLRFKVGYCSTGEYRNRVIFPSFDDVGDLNFFVGRDIYDTSVRYKHPEFDKDIIFNDYLVDWTKPVTLVEGPFDAISAGENSIPLQGTILDRRSRLFRKIVMTGVDVYWALDGDAFKKQLSLISSLLEYGNKSFHVDMRDVKDPNSARKEFSSMKVRAQLVESEIDLIKVRVNACR
jgi:DNA primase